MLDHDDPLSKALMPPKDESPVARAQRLQKQQEATRVSQEIDDTLQESRKAYEKRKKAIKILLLGQAESGKSTTLKNFQLAFTPNHFRTERAAWKTIIQLNLIGSIKKLLEVLQDEMDSYAPAKPVTSTSTSSLSRSTSSARLPASGPLTDDHRRIRMRLSPLLSMEAVLARKLLPENYDPERSREICVRANSGWKATLERATSPEPRAGHGSNGNSRRPNSRAGANEGRNRDDPTAVLAACKDDIINLWGDPVVRDILNKHNVRLEDSPGFFLNDAPRVADLNYEPNDADIVRARVRTFGVEEHKFVMENGAHAGSEWYIYDVGGSRSMRQHWVPYFDDVQAIIFLAPLAFNQVLEEDSRVNRLEDSIYLWKEVCSNALLAHSTLILFLNKMDILQANLNAGISVQKYVPSYGDAPNDLVHVTKYFKDKFRAYQKRLSPRARPFFCHETSAIDTHATSAILVGVREGILRNHLQKMNVI
jgi:guanine nucleotide-binding protein subunit alpha